MIYLHTGLPGAGKTLYSLYHVRAQAQKEGRQVHYFNIADLRIPDWVELSEEQVMKWHELPTGSIIVIDEAQRIFRPRSNGSHVPEHVAKLETHRHSGHDLYLITQHPGLIDNNVRKLVGTHRHIVRAFGAKYATVHIWQQVRQNCDVNRKDGLTERFSYPREVYSWYKSAEVHTHKFRPPARLVFLFLLPLILGAILFYGYGRYQKRVGGSELQAVSSVQDSIFAGSPAAYEPVSAVMSVEDYVASYVPRIADLPHTAPRYDKVTEPVTAPYPAACVEMSGACKCYTEQATPLNLSESACRRIVKNGFFRDWNSVASSQYPAHLGTN